VAILYSCAAEELSWGVNFRIWISFFQAKITLMLRFLNYFIIRYFHYVNLRLPYLLFWLHIIVVFCLLFFKQNCHLKLSLSVVHISPKKENQVLCYKLYTWYLFDCYCDSPYQTIYHFSTVKNDCSIYYR